MEISEKLIGTLEPTTNRAKARYCSQLLDPHGTPLEPAAPMMLLQPNRRQAREIKGMVEALEPQIHSETVIDITAGLYFEGEGSLIGPNFIFSNTTRFVLHFYCM